MATMYTNKLTNESSSIFNRGYYMNNRYIIHRQRFQASLLDLYGLLRSLGVFPDRSRNVILQGEGGLRESMAQLSLRGSTLERTRIDVHRTLEVRW